MANGMPMVATDTTMSGSNGASSAASSRPAVSAKATPWSTQMSSAMVRSSESGTSGRSRVWDPTAVR